AVLAHQNLLRAGAGPPAQNTPGLRLVPIVMDRDVAFLEEQINLLAPVSAAVLPGAAGVHDRAVALDEHGIVGLQVFARNVLEQRPPGMPVHAVTDRAAGNDAVEN